jgi:RpiR family transcriptional regulator, carbohydrate utilization regulator
MGGSSPIRPAGGWPVDFAPFDSESRGARTQRSHRQEGLSSAHKGGLLGAVEASAPTLRPSEQKVADVVLHDPAKISRATLAEIAGLAGVSEPSVVRFARSLGFAGFRDFKYRLIQSLAPGLPAIYSSIEAEDSVAEIAGKVFGQSISSLRRARELLDMESIEAAVSVLRQASDVIVLGFGASGIVGQDVAQKFPLFGIPVNAPVDVHQQFIAATLATPATVVLAISNTATTPEVLESAHEAHARGAAVIALSGKRGPITEAADITLLVSTMDDTDVYTPSTSRLAALAIVDILSVCVAVNQSPERIADLERMKSRLSDMRKGRGRVEPPPDTTQPDA